MTIYCLQRLPIQRVSRQDGFCFMGDVHGVTFGNVKAHLPTGTLSCKAYLYQPVELYCPPQMLFHGTRYNHQQAV